MPRPSGTRRRPARAMSSALAPLTRRPAQTRSPPVMGWSPASTWSSVVFPAPLGPRTAVTEPAGHRQVDAVQHLDGAVAGAWRPRSSTAVTATRRRGRRSWHARWSPRISAAGAAGQQAAAVEHVDVVAHRA